MSSNDRLLCICSWPKCQEWTMVFQTTPGYELLGKVSRIRAPTDLAAKHDRETDIAKKSKLAKSLAENIGFRKVVIHHIKPLVSSKDLQEKEIYIARHHFPHKYILDSRSARFLSKPIPESTAKECNIGILPHDKANVSCRKLKMYFKSPVVTRNEVEQLVKQLKTDISGVTREVRNKRRQQKLVNLLTPAKNSTISNNITPEETAISGVSDYIASVQELVDKLDVIVLPAVESLDQNCSRKGDDLNKVLSGNFHFTNIFKLLADYHKCTAVISLNIFDADKSLKLCFCSEQGNSLCSRAFICFRVGTDVCDKCQEKLKFERRKLKRKHESGDDWAQPNSSVNIKLLTPESREKQNGIS